VTAPPTHGSQRVLLVPLTARDGSLTRTLLERHGIDCRVCSSLDQAAVELAHGAGVLIFSEEMAGLPESGPIITALQSQPAWSDLPVIVLTPGGSESPTAVFAVENLGNVILLDRPVRVSTLVSSIRTALRARRRQYQLRDTLDERTRLNATLERRVVERTALAEQRATQLAALTSELTLAEARERRRLAQLLHDHLQQLLVAARMNARAISRRVSDHALQNPFERLDTVLRDAIAVSRSLTVELSPPILYDAGLGPALHWLARWMKDKHNLEVRVTVEPGGEPQAEDVRVLLFQAARELAFNIVKHAGVSEAAMTLAPAKDGAVELTVSDNGRGFHDDPLTMVTRGGEHFGLFSIRERLMFLGESLDIDTAPGRGARVTLRAPAVTPPKPAPAPIPPPQAIAPAPEPPAPTTGQRTRVLLVDDHKIVREGLAGLLREYSDIEVIAEAPDGETAVEYARRLSPDVVIMDVTMPRMGGIEATRHIVAAAPHIRVIGLSMHDQHDMAADMEAAGAVAYLTKGGPVEQLVDCIRRHAPAIV
jgi:signal transduction histidine kinase/ActR/RegA family two-component response regulator